MPLCDYGCGKEAKYQFKNGKYCCEYNYNRCSNKNLIQINQHRKFSEETKRKIGESNKKRKSIEIEENNNILCSYGCGKPARFLFINKKVCCEDFFTKCSYYKKTIVLKRPRLSEISRRKISDSNKGKHSGKDNGMYGKSPSAETRQKMSASSKGKNSGKNNGMYGKTMSEEHKKKVSLRHTGKITSEKTKEKMRLKAIERYNNPEYLEKIKKLYRWGGPNRQEKKL